jgi:hypothetical protein
MLLYYFASEVMFGQTVGKRLLGLRVTGIDGGRPSTAAVAGRTLLRIVDWLPVMYLVGFIAMMAGGVPRRRVGDLAARTVVVRAQPARRRSLALIPLVLVLLAIIGLLVYRAAEDVTTYREHGISFDYPADWRELDTRDFGSAGDAEALWSTAVGTGGLNMVTINSYQLRTAVTTENVDAVEAELEKLVQRSYEQQLAGPERITVDGKPGFRFRSGTTTEGTTIEKIDLFFFDGTTEYQLGCQFDRDKAAEIEQGCDQIVRSFTVT